jgi:hypothetical protein
MQAILLNRYSEMARRSRQFRCSRHFVTQFMQRNHLSYRCVRAARRCEVRWDEVQRFIQGLIAAYRMFPLNHIVNADESMWLVFWQPRKTVSEKWVETVTVEINGGPKACFTLIGSIAANGDRFSLFLITKGVTFRCHKQFGRLFPGSIDHSKSWWVNEELFLRFLPFIHSNRGAGPIALVLDQYPAHVAPLSHPKGVPTRY